MREGRGGGKGGKLGLVVFPRKETRKARLRTLDRESSLTATITGKRRKGGDKERVMSTLAVEKLVL